jgi:hypothetical protein
MEQARAVSQAKTAHEAQAGLATFAQAWRAPPPQAVATFEHEAGADHPLLCVEGCGAGSGAHDFAVRATEPAVAAQVSASGLFREATGSRGGGLLPGDSPECSVGQV